MREICFDTETTGLNPSTGDKVVEIGCVEMIDGIKTGNNFHTYVNPRRDMPSGAFNVHGISAKFLEDKPIFAHIADDFLKYIDGAKLIAHNAKFDMRFLNFELQLINRPTISFDNVIDTLVIARNKFPGAKNTLDALCRRFEIDLGKRTKHGALLDSELLGEVYVELMGGAQRRLKLKDGEDEEAAKLSAGKVKKTIIPSRNYSVDEKTADAHKKFIAENFKNSPWGY